MTFVCFGHVASKYIFQLRAIKTSCVSRIIILTKPHYWKQSSTSFTATVKK